MILTSAMFDPRGGSVDSKPGEWQRNSYTWKGTKYIVHIKIADCMDVSIAGESQTSNGVIYC